YDYDIATGTASNRRTFFDCSAYGPIPDGATVDAEGYLWVAICEGGVVLQLSPQGEVRRAIEMPTRLPASRMFLGRDRGQRCVPSVHSTSLGCAPAESDGWCYVIEGLGVRGLAEPRYRG